MIWDDCSKLIKPGEHSIFSPSQPAFFNYSPEKLREVYRNKKAAEEGTKKHELAAMLINAKERVWKCKKTWNMYVNDAIAYNMDAEIRLYYSEHFSGTVDAISYNPAKRFLRIHDLKTGVTKASFQQLEGYAALFFLHYGRRYEATPENTKMELRIYQNNEARIYEPNPDDIRFKMSVYIQFEQILKEEDKIMELA